jgi:hypothetical protein
MDAQQHWNRRERGELAKLGIPFNPRPEGDEEKHADLCGWCFSRLDDCVKGKPGTCGYAIDNGAHGIQ